LIIRQCLKVFCRWGGKAYIERMIPGLMVPARSMLPMV
jgi:hypothetical protein